jgi:phytoene desaturase
VKTSAQVNGAGTLQRNDSQHAATTAAVVGSGPGGLATALLLAASGVSVTVYEKDSVIGGRTQRLSIQSERGDFHFDTGPTFFLMPYVLDEIFRAAGTTLEEAVDLKRLDPMYRLVFGGVPGMPDATSGTKQELTVDCTQDLAEMARRIAKIEPADGAAFTAMIAANKAKLAAFEPVLRKPFRSALDVMDPSMLKALPHLAPTQSVHAWLAKRFKNPHVRMALSFQTKYLGMSPYKCPSLFTILPYIEYQWGIWHPIGGCNAIMAAMAKRLIELGGRIVTDAAVESLTFDGKKCTGVVVRSERHKHDEVIINADATWALKNLIPAELRSGPFGAGSDQKLDDMDYSCSTFMAYWGIEGDLDLPHHTISISSDYETNIRQIAVTGELSRDPSLYVCNPSAIDKTLAPKGHSSIYMLLPTPNCKAKINWSQQVDRLRSDAIARIKDLTGIDLRSRIKCEQIITPDGWRARNINFGATFNLAHGLNQMLHLRPKCEVPGMRGVWLTGGGTHPGSGLPVIFLSSQIAARLVCEKLGKPYAAKVTPIGEALNLGLQAGLGHSAWINSIEPAATSREREPVLSGRG